MLLANCVLVAQNGVATSKISESNEKAWSIRSGTDIPSGVTVDAGISFFTGIDFNNGKIGDFFVETDGNFAVDIVGFNSNPGVVSFTSRGFFGNNGGAPKDIPVKFGIGTKAPTATLHLDNLAPQDGIQFGSKFKIRQSALTDNNFVMENIAPNGNLYLRSRIGGNTTGNLILNDAGGNVGIGTASPKHKLDIFTGHGNFKTYNYGTEYTVNTSGGWARSIRFRNEKDNSTVTFGGHNGAAFISTGTYTDPQSANSIGYGNQRLTVAKNGNVGIGTTSPTAKLTVHNSGGVGSNQFELRNGHLRNADRFFMRTVLYGSGVADETFHLRHDGQMFVDGNVGIGNPAPDMKLSVKTETRNISRFHSTNTDLITGIRIGRDSSYGDLVNLTTGFGISAGSASTNLALSTQNAENIALFVDKSNGHVGIGTTTNHPDFELSVNGKVQAKEIKVHTGWSDFVFYDDYKLPTLKEVETHIQEKGHLKDIPSAAVVAKEGIFLGEMNSKLLQKIEELTLYTIAQEKKISTLEENKNAEVKELTSQLLKLAKRLEKLENTK